MAKRKRSAGAIVFAGGATLLSLLGLFYALLFAALACDESCDDHSTRWRDDPHAWQWGGTLGIAALATLAVLYALWAAATGRRSMPALCLAAVMWAGWWTWLTL